MRARRGGIYARVTYVDDNGSRRAIEEKAKTRTDAKELIKKMLRDLDDRGSPVLDAARMTFKDLADYYERTYLIEAQYVDGRKVAGLRDLANAKIFLRTLREFFGRMKLRSVRHGDIERFRSARLKTPTKHAGFFVRVTFTDQQGRQREIRRKATDEAKARAEIKSILQELSKGQGFTVTGQQIEEKRAQRSIASVNRELSLLSRILNVAQREGWIAKSPFTAGDSLINLADERKRERILTRDEELRLLAACAGPRAHLRPIIICALDTGMRRGEMFKLRWADVDFVHGVITIRAFNTKTMRERHVAMTERLTRELETLYDNSTQDAEALCFGITNTVKTSFTKVRREAGLMDVRFHDLRHTHATRLVTQQMPLAEVGRMLGHTQANTTYRYVNANVETARRAAAALNEFNRSVPEGERPVINRSVSSARLTRRRTATFSRM